MQCRIFIRGEVDLASAGNVLADIQRAISASDANLRVDCTHLTFIDSSGVRALVDAHSLLESKGRTLTIVNLAPGPQRVFEILGLTDLFNIERISAS